MAVRDDPQRGMFDRELDDSGLEAFIDTIMQTQAEAKQYAGAKRGVKKRLEKLGVGLGDGERVRVGRFVMTGRAYQGGDIEIPPWDTIAPSFSALD